MARKLKGQPAPELPAAQGNENASFYAGTDLVRSYSTDQLRPVERVIFDRHRSELSGRVLEVGCGAGRLIGHLVGIADSVHGIDVSEMMVEHCRSRFPEATFSRSDIRDLSLLGEGSFDALIAAFNVIDAVGDADRRRTMGEFRRVLAPGGLLVMSSHNLAAVDRVVGPVGDVWAQIRARRPRGVVGSLLHLPRRRRNHRRLRLREVVGPGYRIVNDTAHDYSLLHYYISPARQVRQLATHRFELLECFDLEGRPVDPIAPPTDCTELHYVARLKSGDDEGLT